MISHASLFSALAVAIEPLGINPEFPEWLVFSATVLIIWLSYGIRTKRGSRRKEVTFMTRNEDLEQSTSSPSQDRLP